MTAAARLLTDRRRSLLWWAAGMTALVAFTVSLYPSLKNQTSVEDLMRDLPETFRTMVGYQAGVPLTSPAGFLHARLFATVLPVVVLVFGIGAGARAIGGAEEDGTLEPLLANPISRTRLATERYLATIALLATVVVVFTLAVIALAPLFGALSGISPTNLLTACAAVFTLALPHTTLAYTIGAATGRRGPATAIAAAIAVSGYLIQNLLSTQGTAKVVRALSPWHWYLDQNMLAQGPSALALWAPLPVTALLFAIGLAVFRRRDLR
ncbi:ABC transporter permease subunit [Actinomadura sp. HBU206391]|uniref:ABC transporter permease subunit n=1 Tax=Actinomadura sp. HBU206391 TaxID=2731692 RepID=UPI0016505B44|nr:ABC transporter permease subunit [Actinomadura sp. HBU206391]MBC6463335.1 ABC transporter permease subunit [Actinomadura sp. HBU206391]